MLEFGTANREVFAGTKLARNCKNKPPTKNRHAGFQSSLGLHVSPRPSPLRWRAPTTADCVGLRRNSLNRKWKSVIKVAAIAQLSPHLRTPGGRQPSGTIVGDLVEERMPPLFFIPVFDFRDDLDRIPADRCACFAPLA